MRFLADQDVYAATIRFLIGLGHDVIPASQAGLSEAEDLTLVRTAEKEERILLTRDRDFGSLVFVQGIGKGVIYLRILPSNVSAVHTELERVLTLYTERVLRESFLVIEPGRHRIRRLRSKG